VQQQRGILRGTVSALRPRQWVKNALVVVAPAAAGRLHVLHDDVVVAWTFLAYCLAASSIYLVNDLRDREADQRHPQKRSRAIAAGEVPAPLAVLLATCAALGAVAVAWCSPTDHGLLIILAIYGTLSLSYSFGAKTVPVIELAIVASGFVLRALAGAVALRLYVSSWFLVVISFGALCLVVGKRLAEQHALGAEAVTHRSVLGEYSEAFLRSALTLSSTVVVTAYCLWAFDSSSGGLAGSHHVINAIRLTVVPMVLAILYVLRLLENGGGGAPEELLLSDRTLQALVVSWAVLFAVGIYA
jgi:decaprenyl-phosphate phosphoribosyltransferase